MKILIYSFNDKLGDGLQKISFIQNLKKIYPNSSITYTTSQKTTLKTVLHPLILNCIDEFIENNQIKSSFFNFFKKNHNFKNLKFDLIIDLQKVVTRTINLKKIKHNFFFSATANFMFSDYKNIFKLKFKDIYIEQFYFNILSTIQKKKIKDLPNIEIPLNEPPKFSKENHKLRIGIAPGAGNIIREWGFSNYLSIAKKLRKKGFDIYFFLGPQEKNYLLECKKNNFECPEWDYENNFISKDIIYTMNLAKKMNCLLCNDSGTAWIFEFAGVKTFKIFGVTNERKFSRPNYCTTLQIKDYGFKNLHSFPISIYEKNLYKFLDSLS